MYMVPYFFNVQYIINNNYYDELKRNSMRGYSPAAIPSAILFYKSIRYSISYLLF